MTSETCPHCGLNLLQWEEHNGTSRLCQRNSCRYASFIFKAPISRDAWRRQVTNTKRRLHREEEE